MKVSKKELDFLNLLDSYLHCCRGGQSNDTYSILEEDDLNEFMDEFRVLFPLSEKPTQTIGVQNETI
jgi:hypothetical protein